jgi:hypothetical protein
MKYKQTNRMARMNKKNKNRERLSSFSSHKMQVLPELFSNLSEAYSAQLLHKNPV